MDAERAHDLSLALLSSASKSTFALNVLRARYANKIKAKPVKLMGLSLAHPLGLAAGLDKQGVAGDALSAMGFSFIEYGTVTPKPQIGNVKPRLFRVPQARAIINRMGFNSIGLDAFMRNIKRQKVSHIKGLNIGKNATTPMHQAIDDYVIGLKAVYQVADYISINISSPNTKGLRDLQNEEALNALLAVVNTTRMALSDQHGVYRPVALKVSPDLDEKELDTICKALLKHKIDGVIATNTTIGRAEILTSALSEQAGGLSGVPLAALSTQCIAKFFKRLQGEIPIIGVGGIEDSATAQEKLDAGAHALQLYTGLIYQGPKVIKRIVNELS